MEKSPKTNKNRDLIIGFLGWFLVGNLVLWFEFAANWDGPALYFGVPLVTVIAIGTLFYKKMNWFAYGILAAVITNTLLWGLISGEVHVLVLLVGASFPLPLGFMMIFVQ